MEYTMSFYLILSIIGVNPAQSYTHFSKSESYSSYSTSSLATPSWRRLGERDGHAMCSSLRTSLPVSGLELPGQVPAGIVTVRVFGCDRLGIEMDQVFMCDYAEELAGVCEGGHILLEGYGDKMDSLSNLPVDVDGLILRVVYNPKTLNAPEFIVQVQEGESSVSQSSGTAPEVESELDWHLHWPEGHIGSTSGVVVANDEDLFVFHRADRRWEADSFDAENNFKYQSPIESDVVLKCSVESGLCDESWGKGLFYLPHGISLGADGSSLWLTDVGSHQVLKLDEDGSVQLRIGTAGQPGEDQTHLCQPADVEEDPVTGFVYVADGYCNSRVAVFDADGKHQSDITLCGDEKSFDIVHGLALDLEKRLLLVADRESSRVCIYSLDDHSFVHSNAYSSPVYALDHNVGFLYVLAVNLKNGESFGAEISDEGDSVGYFGESLLDYPHDLSVHDNRHIFVADLSSPRHVFKFTGKAI